MSDIILNSSINITTNIISQLILQFKCVNCKFINDDPVDTKLNCTRTARYKDNNNKIGCSMYLYKGK